MIPKDHLLELVKQKVLDRALLGLVKKYLDQEVMSELSRWTPETGVRTQRWPNAYFSELGLYSLVQAHARFVQTTEPYHVESRMRENRSYGSAGGGVSS